MKGWYGDKMKHKLASKGIKTMVDEQGEFRLYETSTTAPIISAHLEVEQVIYVPSTNLKSETITNREMADRVEEVRMFLSELFGGYTSINGIGGYVEGGDLIKEPVVKIVSYTTRDDFKNKNDILIEYLENKRVEWGQSSIGYEVEGDMYYLGETRWD